MSDSDGGARGLAPDGRDIDDITAEDECPTCGESPAAFIFVEGLWECYNCGADEIDFRNNRIQEGRA